MSVDPHIAGASAVLLCMAIEWGVGRWKGVRLYRMDGVLSDLGCTLGQLVVQAMLGFSTLSLYAWLEGTFGLFEFPATGVGAWLTAWLLMELAFYWRHRAGHGMRLFWTIHEVHHQSPDYNLAVAQRVGYLQWLHTAVFVLPLAVIGVPLPMFAVLFAAIHFYQFLIHTTLIGTLGPLEHVLMTPSHHRVHHGRNPRYLDTNFGFTLVVWDRLFGTFQAEVEPPVFGTLQPLPTWNPLDNNVRPWLQLGAAMRSAPSLWTALAVPLRHPAWDARTGRFELPSRDAAVGPRPVPLSSGSSALRLGVLGLFVGAAVVGLTLVALHTEWALGVRVGTGLGVLAATGATGLLARGVTDG